MSWVDASMRAFDREGIDLVASLPDSVVAELIERAEADDGIRSVPVSREEEAVGVLSGAWLGHVRGALVCQSSGLANSFNALGSVSLANRFPFVGLVTHRGDLDDHNLAHRPAEYAMPRLLDDIGVRNRRLDAGDDVEQVVTMAARTAFSMEEPYVLLLQPGLTAVADD